MKSSFFAIIFLWLPILAFSQEIVYGNYLMKLTQGNNNINSTAIIDTVLQQYSDSLIEISFKHNIESISFKLTNQTKTSFKIIWDDAVFVTEEGQAHKIFHSGIKYLDKEKPQSPTPVYPGTSINEVVKPSSYSHFGNYGWYSDNITTITKEASGKLFKGNTFDPEMLKRSYKLVIPILIDEKSIEYNFKFNYYFEPFVAKKKK